MGFYTAPLARCPRRAAVPTNPLGYRGPYMLKSSTRSDALSAETSSAAVDALKAFKGKELEAELREFIFYCFTYVTSLLVSFLLLAF